MWNFVTTNEGRAKSVDQANGVGWEIVPDGFQVSRVTSALGITPLRTYADRESADVWHTGPISSVTTPSAETIQFTLTIPPAASAVVETVNEIYLTATLTLPGGTPTPFLLAIGSPTIPIDYDPTLELTIKVQVTMINVSIGTNYTFLNTQAQELSAHESSGVYHSKNNLEATTNPTNLMDVNAGYSVNSLWFNISTGNAFVCLSNVAGSAEWYQHTRSTTVNGERLLDTPLGNKQQIGSTNHTYITKHDGSGNLNIKCNLSSNAANTRTIAGGTVRQVMNYEQTNGTWYVEVDTKKASGVAHTATHSVELNSIAGLLYDGNEVLTEANKNAPNGVEGLDSLGNPVSSLAASNGRSINLPTGFDINGLVVSGLYEGSGLLNSPTSTGWYYIEHRMHSNTTNDWASQSAVGFGGSNPSGNYERTLSAGVWSSWTRVGGATGGSSDAVFYENDKVITSNYTITTGKNAMTAGDITINAGVVVTVPNGSTWTVI